MARTLARTIEELDQAGRLVRIESEVDPFLEAAEIQRRVYRSGGPAVYFSRLRGCRFPAVSNLFGTIDQARFLFRHTLESVRRLIELKIDPNEFWRRPTRYWKAPWAALGMLPKVRRGRLRSWQSIRVGELPQIVSWPDDGGAFITLPQVFSENVEQPGVMHSNLGMYRVQLSGGQYAPDQEIGLHYQIHRGIGVHHAAALRQNKPFRVNIFVGGTPSMTLAAVMPLPEGMSELTFAGALAGFRIPLLAEPDRLPVYRDADFIIRGVVEPNRLLPEGPFGDHLGYYSLAHDFPVLRVEEVLCRADSVWPFTAVGRPPQEDTVFGELIHELTGPVIPTVLAGVHAVHAVDASGVHPLLLAIGSERYTPYRRDDRPAELLTQASAILGQGQMSLAKYLFIVNRDDDPELHIHNVAAFLQHALARVDWRRDLHFHTCTTIDTLDYSGDGFNAGSKVVIAASGQPRRALPAQLDFDPQLPDGFSRPLCPLPGVLVVQAPAYASAGRDTAIEEWTRQVAADAPLNRFPLVLAVDDSEFTAASLNNLIWVAFTRSNPARDLHGVGSFTRDKHWGCEGSLILDARRKPHHAPPLIEDPAVMKKVDALAAREPAIGKYL
ncbi:UbiD family decarboxylase [Lignipirellula cremea]|uniref:4-hydroxybenzoate decarboxylase subunit C n=1 Tax=Lignipirellula cremea TaxID=2528010 RepID=A0A518E566_9BACT|nr:UbiD family decarboxylase [Lignipirellula cremea]QDU99234.1 4-hydroxybenzoate decarboxylase subunit C [Lignipirellula cremea]